MGVWLSAALVLSRLLWWCEANAGTRSSVLSPAERAAPGWWLGDRQQVYREAEHAQWRAQPGRGGTASLCAEQPGERGSMLPCGHSLLSLWGLGLFGLICAILSALLFLQPLLCGMKCLAFCVLPLFCPLTTQVSSVFVGRVVGKRKRQKKALLI